MELNSGKKKAESGGHHRSAAEDRCAVSLLVGNDLMVIHRLIEMG